MDNSEATRKKATECNKETFLILIYFFLQLEAKDERLVTFGHELEGAKRNLLGTIHILHKRNLGLFDPSPPM